MLPPSLLAVALSAVASDAFLLISHTRIQAAAIDSGDEDFGGSMQSKINPNETGNDTRTKSQSRRKLILASLMMPISQLKTNKADAACLPGDIREDCIGVYKLKVGEAESRYTETPEKLKMYAPDLQWVPQIENPSSYQNAINQLKEQRQNFDISQEQVAKGDIKQAGLILLDVVPQVTAAGRYIIKSYNSAANDERNKAFDSDKANTLEMKAYRIEYALNECLGYLGETDVLIGQALRGELGVSAPAQIAILEQLNEARKEFDEFLRTVPEKF